MQATETWDAQFADFGDELEKPSRFGYDFKYKVGYQFVIKHATLATSNRGDIQIELEGEIHNKDGEVLAPKHREWLVLPKQISDQNFDREKVLTFTKLRRDALREVLAAADRKFSIGEGRTPSGGWYGADHTELSREDILENEVAANRATMAYADELHSKADDPGPVDLLVDTIVTLVKSENKKNDRFPHTNFYAFFDPKLELA